ncbi:MAG: NAD(P)/FAD-dependent oxidoreductase [Propionibacteriaceae bacterium]|nr:NAD(P)/FAD-dependent oxidoreductase [Propionibacteriaceae bacterium]
MKDVVIVGGGLAGLSAAWRLRHWDTVLLEADLRVGGRIRSERRGQYWMNWGGHVFAGPGTATDSLLVGAGVTAVDIPGSLQGLHLNGKFIPKGAPWSYPFRVPMSMRSRLATIATGAKVVAGVARYTNVVRSRPGESAEVRQKRIYDFDNDRTFAELIGTPPRDTASLFEVTVTRSAGNMDELAAGSGIGYFSHVHGIGQGLKRGVVGGPSTLTEAVAATLGDRIELGARVHEVVHRPGSVVVRYTQDGRELEVEARTAVLATTADVSHRIGVDLPEDLRDALGQIKYGPQVSSAFLTNETTRRPWDDNYAIATPKRSFAIVLNQANIVRGSEAERQPGGSIMVFSPAALGARLLDKTDQEIQAIHLRDLEEVLGPGFGDTVIEAGTSRWQVGTPYCFPGRARLQTTLLRGADRVYLAGDYTGTLYSETAIASGFTAAQRAVSVLATERQTRFGR